MTGQIEGQLGCGIDELVQVLKLQMSISKCVILLQPDMLQAILEVCVCKDAVFEPTTRCM